MWAFSQVIHLLVGDGINTNESAAKRVLEYFSRRDWQAEHKISYSLVALRCSSHQSNLTVAIAICGELLAKPQDRAASCSTHM